MLRFLGVPVVVSLVAATVSAQQQPSLRDVLARLDAYLRQYEQTLASVVAEERYAQTVRTAPPRGDSTVLERRTLRSDYALARSPEAWTGFRDTYEVDGEAVRGRDERLAALLASGSADSAAQAMRISRENARYNIGEEVATRTINVPTIALDLAHPRNRDRFSFSRREEQMLEGTAVVRIGFEERRRPTIIRGPSGRDQRSRGSILVNPSTGEVLRTRLEWDGEPVGFIEVEYRKDAHLGVLVPWRMVEQYRRAGMQVSGEATYTNYRRFQTSGRIVP